MSILAEGRELLQDLIVPEFKALQEKVSGVKEEVSELRAELRAHADKEDARFEILVQSIHELSTDVKMLTKELGLDKRISRFEERLREVEKRTEQR